MPSSPYCSPAKLKRQWDRDASPTEITRDASEQGADQGWEGQVADVFSVSTMASEKPKRDIADFFRPYSRSHTTKSIPTKRQSPTTSHEPHDSPIPKHKQQKRPEPRTPVRPSRHVEHNSPFGPHSGVSVKIPIRSPKPSPSQNTAGRSRTNFSAVTPRALFASLNKTSHREKGPLSLADIPPIGQTIVKDGKVVAVRSSDDEESDSLCSLDDILGRNRRDLPTGSSTPPDVGEEDLEAQRVRSLSIFSNGRSNALVSRAKLQELASKANRLNFDIGLLVGDHFDDQEIEANVAKAKQGYKAADNQERLKQWNLDDKKLLASLIGQDDGTSNVQRLLNAVERTDALATDYTWSMFDPNPASAHIPSTQPFPEGVAALDLWSGCLAESSSRNGAYLSGYVAEKVAQGTFPDDLVTWTFNSIIGESRDDLRDCYIKVVGAASHKWTNRNLKSGLVEQTFLQLGADPVMMKCASDIRREMQAPAEHHATRNARLVSAIQTMMTLYPDMSVEALFKFVNIIMRLALDTHLMGDSRLCVVVEDAVSSLLGHSQEQVSISVAQCILEDIGLRVKDRFLQVETLKHILPTSSVSASLRVQLANLFLLGTTKKAIVFDLFDAGVSLPQLTLHLHDPAYDVSNSNRQGSVFDYSTLSSLALILDAAIANGGRPSTFSDPSSERDFNRNVDLLAQRIKSIIISIADTGASHMRRTEAKEALNALHFRLLYGVRTQPRPKKSVFGGRDGTEYRAEERSAGMMQQFLARRKEHKALRERDANVTAGRGVGTLSDESESEELIRKQLGVGG